MSFKPITTALLSLTDQPYDNYNAIVLPEVRRQIEEFDLVGYKRLTVFEDVFSEELPLTTLRRAIRTAIKLALGEEGVEREYDPKKKFRKNN
jgi:hypothetical protein